MKSKFDIIYNEPEYHGALIKVNSASEETVPSEQGEEVSNPETPSAEETVPQTEVTENDGPQNPEKVTKPEDHHHHHHHEKPHHSHGHNNHGQSSSKPLEAIGQKIAEEITTAITNIANFIISLF